MGRKILKHKHARQIPIIMIIINKLTNKNIIITIYVIHVRTCCQEMVGFNNTVKTWLQSVVQKHSRFHPCRCSVVSFLWAETFLWSHICKKWSVCSLIAWKSWSNLTSQSQRSLLFNVFRTKWLKRKHSSEIITRSSDTKCALVWVWWPGKKLFRQLLLPLLSRCYSDKFVIVHHRQWLPWPAPSCNADALKCLALRRRVPHGLIPCCGCWRTPTLMHA